MGGHESPPLSIPPTHGGGRLAGLPQNGALERAGNAPPPPPPKLGPKKAPNSKVEHMRHEPTLRNRRQRKEGGSGKRS
eukprot:scaffold161784_cov28-Tisochrysis_lutea.AAC.1